MTGPTSPLAARRLRSARGDQIAIDLDSFPLVPTSIPSLIWSTSLTPRSRLPPEFRTVSCFRQFTAGHGIKPGGRVQF